MEYQRNEYSKSTQEKKAVIGLKAYLIGCVCWDCDDLTDEELEECFEEVA